MSEDRTRFRLAGDVNRVGQRTKCTPELAKDVSNHIASGLSSKDAMILAGVNHTSFYKWRKRGETAIRRVEASNAVDPNSSQLLRDVLQEISAYDRAFAYFYVLVERAIPKRKKVLIDKITSAATGGDEHTESHKIYKTVTVPETKELQKVLVSEKVITKTAEPKWQASAWLLERLHPEEFSKRTRIDVYDWKAQLGTLFNEGSVSREEIIETFGETLAAEFFQTIGRPELLGGDALMLDAVAEGTEDEI